MNRRALLVVCVSAALSACATTRPPQDAADTAVETPGVQLRVADPGALVGFGTVCIAKPEMLAAGLDPGESAKLEEALVRNLEEALTQDRSLVPESDGGCLLVRTRVLAVVKANVAANVLVGLALPIPLPVVPSRGGVTLQGEALDPANGRQLAAISYQRREPAVSFSGGWTATGGARGLTRDFSRAFARALKPERSQ